MGSESRWSRWTVVAVVLIALLLAGQAAVALHHGTHAQQAQDCAVCVASHAGGPLPATLALPFPAILARRLVASTRPILPDSIRLDSASARAPPPSTLAA